MLHERFFIGNEWRQPATDAQFTIKNASTGEAIGTTPEAGKADIDAAVVAARTAFDSGIWSGMAPSERATIMRRFAEELRARSAQTAKAVSTQNGMPISISGAFEGDVAPSLLDYYADMADDIVLEDTRPSQFGKETYVQRLPVGVVAAIIPWNFPVNLSLVKLGPAMAAGCTMVIKPSPGTVLDSYVMAEAALAAGVPPGVLNWVPADREVGAYLIEHPGVDKVAFTGSTEAGRKIAARCGELLRPVTLELGGKSAAIVLDDADMETFTQGIPTACLLNNGQTCYLGTRILAPRSRYGEVVDAVVNFVSGLKVGDAMDPETQIGPVASEEHRERVERYIAIGKDEARLVAGGRRPDTSQGGWFVEPTVFADVDNHATIARDEIFGPVLSIIPYDAEEDAIEMANDSEFGLGGSVWSADNDHALDVAQRVKTGSIGLNGYVISIGSPFGGIKSSGIGREFGPEALLSYQQYKSIYAMT
ncbi:MAG: aldehyde dehydrogenase [Pseudomonadota bacterium]